MKKKTPQLIILLFTVTFITTRKQRDSLWGFYVSRRLFNPKQVLNRVASWTHSTKCGVFSYFFGLRGLM